MRFSDQFGITERTAEDDWFDPVVTEDTPLYIDPFLVFEDADLSWSSCHQQVVDFFNLALSYVKLANGNTDSLAWRKATQLLTFPEPKEFAFGLSMGSPEGAGTAEEYAERMATALDIFRLASIDRVDYIETFVLFCDGLGVDRISDIFCNIAKARFITYTKDVASRHSIAREMVSVRHSSWTSQSGRWKDEQFDLPRSPVFNGGVLLSPSRFLKEIPRITPEGFYSWAEVNAGSTLRNDLNFDLGSKLTQAEKREAAREVATKNPDLALTYVSQSAAQPHSPYDIVKDPLLLVGWEEAGKNAALLSPTPIQPMSQHDFSDWVRTLLESFKHVVEETDLWTVLWNDGMKSHRTEKIAQAVAHSMFVAQCQAANVDVSREVDLGRGSVDFKFSQGWSLRALTEVKFISSTQFFKGAKKQLPQYLKSAQIECGYYLCIGFTEKDFEQERLDRVTETCSSLSNQKGITLTPIYVDARPETKLSASKL